MTEKRVCKACGKTINKRDPRFLALAASSLRWLAVAAAQNR
jgi:hypothetical protein